MRIAHISDSFAPRLGGIETQVAALAEHQRRAGAQVQIMTATPGPPMNHVTRISMQLPAELPVHPRTRAHVVSALRRQPADVLHIHLGVVSPFAWGAMRAARQLGIPTVVTVHSMWGAFARGGYALALRSRVTPSLRLAAVSTVAAAAIARAIPQAVPVAVTPNGIDPVPWRIAAQPDPAAPRHFVTVMRLAPRKRLGALLRIFRAIVADGLDARLTIIGDGPLRSVGERQAGDLPVTFTGSLNRAAMLDVFGNAHAFVQPSTLESFGIAALEARCAGLPIMARQGSGADEFVRDGIEGFLVDSDTQMRDTMVGVTPDVLQRIRQHNMSTDPPVTWPRVLPMVQQAYAAAGAD